MKRKNVKIWVSNLEKYKNSKLEKCSTKGGGGASTCKVQISNFCLLLYSLIASLLRVCE